LGEGAIRAILDVRTRLGGLTSLHQLCEELDLRVANKRVFEALVKSGACDGLIPQGVPLATGRAMLFGAVDSALEHGSRVQRDRERGQADLFGGGEGGDDDLTIIRLPDSPPWSEMTLLAHEKDALGLYLRGHPVGRF